MIAHIVVAAREIVVAQLSARQMTTAAASISVAAFVSLVIYPRFKLNL